MATTAVPRVSVQSNPSVSTQGPDESILLERSSGLLGKVVTSVAVVAIAVVGATLACLVLPLGASSVAIAVGVVFVVIGLSCAFAIPRRVTYTESSYYPPVRFQTAPFYEASPVRRFISRVIPSRTFVGGCRSVPPMRFASPSPVGPAHMFDGCRSEPPMRFASPPPVGPVGNRVPVGRRL